MGSEVKSSTKEEQNNEKKRKHEEDSSSKKLTKEERKELKAKKKAAKEAALAQVPKVDEDGISYTKIQIKRMVKRVKRGLPPVPTEQEERDRIKRLKTEERETQDELAGMIYKAEENGKVGSDVDEDDMDRVDDDDDVDKDVDVEENSESDGKEDDTEEKVQPKCYEASDIDSKAHKKKKRAKAVPADYTCFACKNKHTPLHWIYDCPDKIRKPGSNNIKKKQRGVHDPSSRKVFVSGLPFEAKSKDIEAYFEKEMKCGKVVHCKLLLFEDTKRCKGNGFITFDTDESAKKALKLHGTTFSLPEEVGAGAKKKTRKELKLGVKKVLDRTQTKTSN
jgi:hypothetical protein